MKIWPVAVVLLLLLSTAGTTLLSGKVPGLMPTSEPTQPSRDVRIILSPSDADLDTYNVLHRGKPVASVLTDPAIGTSQAVTSSPTTVETILTTTIPSDDVMPDMGIGDNGANLTDPIDLITGAQAFDDPAHGILVNSGKPFLASLEPGASSVEVGASSETIVPATPTPTPMPTVDANGVVLEKLSPDQFETVSFKRYVKVSLARIRKEPISTAEAIAKVTYGDVLTVTGIGSSWSRVKLTDGKTGFILSELLTATAIVKPTPTVVPTPTKAPTPTPTKAPTKAPSPTPTKAPTKAPSPTPTKAPAPTPTKAPAPTPTSAPVQPPSTGGMTSEQEQQMIALAKSALGVDYVYGGSSMSGFDCSGFTRYIYLTMFNIRLPHSAKDQCLYSGTALAKPLSLSAMRVGDIICFDWSSPLGVCDHVGLYIGDGQYIHASNSRDEVVQSTLNLTRNPILEIKRIIN